jgi:hypothetical protein
MTDLLPEYWSEVKPQWLFLKEFLERRSGIDVNTLFNKEIDREFFDPFMIREAPEFLRLSIINLLAYKHLVCGNYLAWARVTIYYSQFYVVNCLLRLRKFALVHLNPIDGKPSTIRIEESSIKPNYKVQKCNTSGHQIIWGSFARFYPKLSSKKLGEFSIRERTDWNYDLFYASQSTDEEALRQVQDRCRNNFLDPNYGISSTEEAAEYFHDMMANFGFEEAGTGQYQKYAIDCLSDIGKVSKYSEWYCSHFNQILENIKVLEAPQEMKNEISNWLIEGNNKIKEQS